MKIIKSKTAYINVVILVIFFSVLAFSLLKEKRTVNSLKENYVVTVARGVSNEKPEGKYLSKLEIEYMYRHKTYRNYTLPFYRSIKTPEPGGTCIVAYDKDNPKTVAIITGVFLDEYKFGEELNSIIDTTHLEFNWLGTGYLRK
ncbi:DUF3592 domain-containing protein [Lewinella cohaerens]|uniref:DUF3592 domain-containing protein n=1 Tax=Lewinella cohaerens TaxID=70995 RepID=UPI0003603985|nr:DUF3592 domain-containing protein [Lewinella cohaerens]